MIYNKSGSLTTLAALAGLLAVFSATSVRADPVVDLAEQGPTIYKFLTLKNIEVAVKTYGSHTNPPILLLHGYTSSSLSFAPLIENLSKSHYLVIPDLPFHGESYISATRRIALQSDPANYFQLCDELIEKLIKHFSLKDTILLGHGMGGTIAASYAIKSPQDISGVIMMESAPIFKWKMAGSCSPDCSGELETEKAISLLNKVNHGEQVYKIIWASYLKQNATRILTMKTPVLWLMNTDQITGNDYFTRLLQADGNGNPRAELKTVSMRGHYVQWTATEEVQAIIDAFLAHNQRQRDSALQRINGTIK